MSILIGHASIDENGKIVGGKPGDQTKKEVCTRKWYNGSWDCVIRCTDSKIASKMVQLCKQACSNDKIGYDQKQRNTLYTQAKKVGLDFSKINTLCECDCSSLMCTCAICAGVEDSLIFVDNNMRTTRTMREAFKKTPGFKILTDKKYLTSDKYLKAGDILLKEGKHTVMALEDGANIKNESYVGKGIGTATALCNMNVRKGEGVTYKKIGSIKKNNNIEVLKITSKGWYKIVWPDVSCGYGYVSNKNNKYFKYNGKYKAIITAKTLNVRSGAGLSYKINKKLYKNETVTIIKEKAVGKIIWGKLEDNSGWISLKYIKKI